MTDTGRFVPEVRFMRLALDAARRALLAGEPPVGACIVAKGQVVTTTGNGVIGGLDITAHAEILAIREACRQRRGLSLENCQLYATVEPCMMCRGACHYAGISTVVFGATLDDMHRVTGDELSLGAPALGRQSQRIAFVGDCLREESVALLDEWALMRQGTVAT